jgi:hypothetical protein
VVPDGPVPAALPVGLAYDELPPGSDVRREYGADGAVTITAPAGEPSAAARRAAAQRTGVSSAIVCGFGLTFLLAVMLSVSNSSWRMHGAFRVGAVLLFGVVCAGVFLLAWWVSFRARLEALAEARRQAVVLHADARRLLVETAGPLGRESLDLAANDVEFVGVVAVPWTQGGSAPEAVPCLRVDLRDGRTLRLMPGRHEAELRWVGAALSQALGAKYESEVLEVKLES